MLHSQKNSFDRDIISMNYFSCGNYSMENIDLKRQKVYRKKLKRIRKYDLALQSRALKRVQRTRTVLLFTQFFDMHLT